MEVSVKISHVLLVFVHHSNIHHNPNNSILNIIDDIYFNYFP